MQNSRLLEDLILKATPPVMMIAAATLPARSKGNAGLRSKGKSEKLLQPLFLGQKRILPSIQTSQDKAGNRYPSSKDSNFASMFQAESSLASKAWFQFYFCKEIG
ncbi:hypothetical protein Ngar_c25060 [Candidatus Nitrososphaera gargensis Ga9.2]|uniref:Uncharacterized protein n=1 Tax=Nitrososphaera gargensis (strain Ga9.2) TaxID=1237085 RepID=K0INI4_NITGG|nr:hypothetical protein Ngar_c25060 [Candidatus Nitrososphaera gargensis Ga9.2]